MKTYLRKLLFSIPKIYRWFLFLSYITVIAFGSLMPPSMAPKLIQLPYADKVIHFTMYFGYCILFLWAVDDGSNRSHYHRSVMSRGRMYLLALIFSITWGFGMEVFQLVMKIGRSYSIYDMYANISGAVVGILLYHFTIKK